jgi:hypothetical protein
MLLGTTGMRIPPRGFAISAVLRPGGSADVFVAAVLLDSTVLVDVLGAARQRTG